MDYKKKETKESHGLQEEGDQGVSWTTSLGSIRAVIFEVSCKSISHKSLSLIKIENCLVLSNNRSRH